MSTFMKNSRKHAPGINICQFPRRRKPAFVTQYNEASLCVPISIAKMGPPGLTSTLSEDQTILPEAISRSRICCQNAQDGACSLLYCV